MSGRSVVRAPTVCGRGVLGLVVGWWAFRAGVVWSVCLLVVDRCCGPVRLFWVCALWGGVGCVRLFWWLWGRASVPKVVVRFVGCFCALVGFSVSGGFRVGYGWGCWLWSCMLFRVLVFSCCCVCVGGGGLEFELFLSLFRGLFGMGVDGWGGWGWGGLFVGVKVLVGVGGGWVGGWGCVRFSGVFSRVYADGVFERVDYLNVWRGVCAPGGCAGLRYLLSV